MAGIPFIDTHVHFYDLAHPTLEYGWLRPGVKHHILEAIEPIQAQRYWADDWVAESRFSNVSKSIHVECAVGTPDPVEETRWMQAFADRLGHPHGIVAEVHVAKPDTEAVIERHMEFANMRRVRDFGKGDYAVDPAGYICPSDPASASFWIPTTSTAGPWIGESRPHGRVP